MTRSLAHFPDVWEGAGSVSFLPQKEQFAYLMQLLPIFDQSKKAVW